MTLSIRFPSHASLRQMFLIWIAALACTFAFVGTASAWTACVNPWGAHGCYHTISSAVAAASAGDIITVWPGTYHEQVTITKPLSLVTGDEAGATIDASGKANGIFVDGMGSGAPLPGFANVLISGFRVINANFEGILIANVSNVTLFENTVSYNNRALDIKTPECAGIPAFETNEAEDCGEGIHLMGADHATIAHNEVSGNSGGILISDETGPSADNLITGNNVHDNPFDCGITLASHARATTVVAAGLPFGVWRNTISHNKSWNNGLDLPGAGAGIGVFAPFPGTTNTANVIIGNEVRDNGLPGVTMHNHAAAPKGMPPVNLNDNVIVGNYISGNRADTDDAATPGPTGINLFSKAPVTGTIIEGNHFDDEAYNIVFKAPSGQIDAHLNNFSRVGIDNTGTGTVNATENWWDCKRGPGSGNCASVSGSGVVVKPWLSQAVESHEEKH